MQRLIKLDKQTQPQLLLLQTCHNGADELQTMSNLVSIYSKLPHRRGLLLGTFSDTLELMKTIAFIIINYVAAKVNL